MNKDRFDRGSDSVAGPLDLLEKRLRERIGSVGERRDPSRRRQDFTDQLDAFARQLRTDASQPSDISARPGKALYKAGFDRIADQRHDNRYIARRLPCGARGRREPGNDDISLESDQFRRQIGERVRPARPKLVSDVLPLEVA